MGSERVHLHLGDWREAVASWPSPCVLVTDPPYGIDYVSAEGVRVVNDADESERDAAIESVAWSAAAVFGHLWKVPHWGRPAHVLVWDKGIGCGMGNSAFPWKPTAEAIAVYGDGWEGHRGPSVLYAVVPTWFEWSKAHRAVRTHPTEKPISVLREIIGKAPPGLPIVDPFMGSGTTGVAAVQCGREFYGAELVPEYFAVAQERLTNTPKDGAQRSQSRQGRRLDQPDRRPRDHRAPRRTRREHPGGHNAE